jgi:hypothetical protein
VASTVVFPPPVRNIGEHTHWKPLDAPFEELDEVAPSDYLAEVLDEKAVAAAVEEHGNLVENAGVEDCDEEDREAKGHNKDHVFDARNLCVGNAAVIAASFEPVSPQQAADRLWQSAQNKEVVQESLQKEATSLGQCTG